MNLTNFNIEVVIVIPKRKWYSFSICRKTCIKIIWYRFFLCN